MFRLIMLYFVEYQRRKIER